MAADDLAAWIQGAEDSTGQGRVSVSDSESAALSMP
jgi:hypothetical protein